MIITVLGSGSNGGVPQWDCCCPNCTRARETPGLRRTRSSLAVSLDGVQHVLIDATPDLRQQLEAVGLTPIPEEADSGRQSRIDAVLLTHGHGDHTVGIAEFSTGKSFEILVYGPPDLIRFLFGSPGRRCFFGDLGRLARNYVSPRNLEEGERRGLLDGLTATGFEVVHTDRLEDGTFFPSSTFGYELEADGRRFVYAPDLGLLSDRLLNRVQGADLFMLDATFWWDDELAKISGLRKSSYDLGHVPVEESVEILKGMDIGRVVYTHLNHTNPLLDPAEPMTKIVEDVGLEIAHDGMVIKL
jgi:pyrroloquinoline quinone biosynthesis protein B